MEENRTETKHIVNAYDTELRTLHALISRMGATTAEQLADAITAIVDRDADVAARVMQRDELVDQLEREVEAHTLRLLALRQPMARDLREVIAALRISNNLERVGDFAANVAKRALALNSLPEVTLARSLRPIGRIACEMIHDIMRAYDADDIKLAMAVRDRDQELDRAYTSLFRELLTYMMETPQRITSCTHLLFAAKNLERIGDHATNIAETLCFRISGRLPDEEREKGDLSAFEVVKPGELPANGAGA
ncbi:phosphate signaling complex protein PhoU [Indioceanicola profundi]|uniref:phosphate signaling complex protein PhoU n=1 Tax=Indioceanicola profundi TaxID=2220096 RepID=UPI001CEDCCF8|nr:phosphate signaling complex protein PhoU [Indioceanicola profundi]